VVRRIAIVLGAVLAAFVLLIALAIGGVYLNGQRIFTAKHDNPAASVQVPMTPERIQRGRDLIAGWSACVDCHQREPGTSSFVLDGGVFDEAPEFGTYYAPNLTPGGKLNGYTDGEIIRAIREGVSKDGRGLMIMPSSVYRNLSDEDVQAIVAYLRSQPAVEGEAGVGIHPTFLATMLVGAGIFPTSRQAPVASNASPPRGPTAQYGGYLASISGCKDCHGQELDGEVAGPGPPPGPSLLGVKGWTAQQFLQTIRGGVTPGGKQLSDDMPWKKYALGTDADIIAVYEYLKSFE
jgi:mono/diheme cytochrome c family protein